jgi:hypothetical protein
MGWLDDERQRRWAAHCLRMAVATHDLADWSEDMQMMRAYLALAAKWIVMAEAEPPGPCH